MRGFGRVDPQALLTKLQPFFLRRTKAAVHEELGLPAQHHKNHYVDATHAELIFKDLFVLRTARDLLNARGARVDDEDVDDLLSTHLQLSNLSPELWSQWGSDKGRSRPTGPGKLVNTLKNFTLVPEDLGPTCMKLWLMHRGSLIP